MKQSIARSGSSTGTLCLLAFLPCFAAVFGGWNASSAPKLMLSKDRPALLFGRYLYHHGEHPVSAEHTLKTRFKFVNKGDKPVQIGEIERSCGCLVPVLSSRTIAPGELGVLEVPLLTAREKPGPHEYHLTVNYTDPQPRSAFLTIAAVIPEQKVIVQPKAQYLAQKTDQPFPLSPIRISDFRETPLLVENAECTADFIRVEVDAASQADGVIPVSFEDAEDQQAVGSTATLTGEVAGSIPAGRHHAIVFAETTDNEYPFVTVPMVIRGPDFPEGQEASIFPEQFQFYASEQPDVQWHATLKLQIPADWKLTHANTWPEQLDVQYGDGVPSKDKPGFVDVSVLVQLTELPPKNLTDGVIQLYANDGKQLITAKANFVWP